MSDLNPLGPDPQEIRKLFGSIAHGYDRANDLMTFGFARSWRKQLVKWSGAKAGDQVLDCATGTGDLALDFKRAVGPSGQVIGTDFCHEMLEKAPHKALSQGLKIEFAWADAMSLPYDDQQFDVVSMAYGIRNVGDARRALIEMARVCKPGGRVMILETGDSQWPVFKTAVQFYFRQVVPRLGGLVTGRRNAYEYLTTSSLKFPSRDRFVALMKSLDLFASVEYRSVMGGASFIYRGVLRS